jgi:hypothetical protein
MEKQAIVDSLRAEIRAQYARAVAALEGSRDAATGEDAKAESKYDTRGLEASYLAAGQAEQADELSRAVTLLDSAEFPSYDFDDPIGPGALVEVERDDEILYFLLAPAGGGLALKTEEGESITILGPAAPLRAQLEGKRSGEVSEDSEIAILEVF